MLRLGISILMFSVAAVLELASPARAGDVEDAAALGTEVVRLYGEGRYQDAVPLAQKALSLREKLHGPGDPEVNPSLKNLAQLYNALGRATEAEPLFKRALGIDEQVLGPDHTTVGLSLNNLAAFYQFQGRYAEAEPLYQRALSIFEAASGTEDASVATCLNNLAELYKELGRFAEAEPLLKRALSIRETTLGLDNVDVGQSLNNLATLLIYLGRAAEAEPLYKRDLAIAENALGPDDAGVALILNNLAYLYKGFGRLTEAEPLYLRALSIREKALGPNNPYVGQSLNNLAQLYIAQGRMAEAEPLLKRDLEISEASLGAESPAASVTRNNLAEFYELLGRNREAEPLYKRALANIEKSYGADHPLTGAVLDNLAGLSFADGDWAGAVARWQQSTGIVIQRFKRSAESAASSVSADATNETSGLSGRFRNLVKAADRLAKAKPAMRQTLSRDMFQIAQWAQGSSAAQSLAQMAARSASRSTALAQLVRERQDLTAEWELKDKLLIAARSQAPAERNSGVEASAGARLGGIDKHISEIDAEFAKTFPDYAAMASPQPLALEDVQAQLGADEALIVFLDTSGRKPAPEETFIWVVTKTDSRWVRSDFGTEALRQRVEALRCGLDDGAWRGEGQSKCARAFGLDSKTPKPRPLPFDVAKSFELYKGLFGEFEDLIKGKHLLLVPSGALTALPFQVLVTSASAGSAPQGLTPNTPWLTRRHALTVLPSVSSLAALRRNAKGSDAPEAFIGFGDPVLTGSPRCGKIKVPDKCPGEEIQVAVADSEVTRSAGEADATESYFRNGLADVVAVNTRLCPLPDTAFELKCVARSLGAPGNSIVLGADMTETNLKSLPLYDFKVVHFATHGLLAGETAQLAKNNAEPALVFSPPDLATEGDDGLLTASEVAGLKLNADWVIMSACNTAGGGEPGAEALSGLAKAFFYAGARALLVSHWPVNSTAATMLTSRTFAELKKDASIGRSEALRRAMLALMSDEKRPWAAHPSIWAPFVVVGEGGAGR